MMFKTISHIDINLSFVFQKLLYSYFIEYYGFSILVQFYFVLLVYTHTTPLIAYGSTRRVIESMGKLYLDGSM
jgi:hypothetical protein